MAVGHRFIRHACVILVAAAMLVVTPRAVATLSGTAVQGGFGDGVSLNGATIEHSPQTAVIPDRPAQTIVANPGDTVDALAAALHSDAGALRWANNITGLDEPRPGQSILVPPGPGALVKTRAGERPSTFARRLGLDPRIILDYNTLRSDVARPPGTYLQVPQGAAPGGSLSANTVVPVSAGVPEVVPNQILNLNRGAGRFPDGQCTYYVSMHRNVTWNGDAETWLSNARGIRPEGAVPVEGSILVLGGGWVGHVAYVEHVNPDGSFEVSEMNVKGVGVLDHRTLTGSEVNVLGFIY